MSQPPQVTIRDPSLPGSQVHVEAVPADDAWRPARRTVLVVGAVLLVLLVAASAVATSLSSARQRAAERRLDAAAAAAVQLALVEPAGSFMLSEGQVMLALRNDSGRDLRIVRVRVDEQGYGWQDIALRLAPAAQGNLMLTSTPVCRPELADHGAARLLLQVTTDRGTTVPAQVPLFDGTFGSPVTAAARAQCAILPPAQSLDAVLTVERRSSPTSVLLSGSFTNASILPLSLTGLRGVPGLTASTPDHLPLVLPPRPDPHSAADLAQPVRVLLTVDCAYLRAHPAGTEAFVAVVAAVRRGDTTVESPQYLDEAGLTEVQAMAARCRR